MLQEATNKTEEALDYLEKGKNVLIEYGPKVLSAIGLLVVGMYVIKRVINSIRTKSESGKLDATLIKFLLSMLKYALVIFLIITCLGLLGFESTALAGVLAGLALGIGLALQGSLSNVAGGLLIMLLKPYKLGDLIEGQGEIGHVKDIDIFTTKIITPQNKLVVIPNGAMSNGNITNYTTQGVIKVFHTIGVSYDADIKETKDILMAVLKAQEKVLETPAPMVEVCELADSSVNFAVRPACRPEHYWDVYFETLERSKIALDAAGIEIPYPHSVEIQKEG